MKENSIQQKNKEKIWRQPIPKAEIEIFKFGFVDISFKTSLETWTWFIRSFLNSLIFFLLICESLKISDF